MSGTTTTTSPHGLMNLSVFMRKTAGELSAPLQIEAAHELADDFAQAAQGLQNALDFASGVTARFADFVDHTIADQATA